MNWSEFQAEKKTYEAVWKKIKDDASGEMSTFLKKSYIVVSCGRQFNFDDDLITAGQSCPAFFIDQKIIKEMLEINKKLQKLSPLLRRETRNDQEKADQRKAEGQMRALMKEWDSYCPNQLEISPHWRIEVRFPYVDIDLIQELKQSPYCDQDKTMMRPASIAVVLKRRLE